MKSTGPILALLLSSLLAACAPPPRVIVRECPELRTIAPQLDYDPEPLQIEKRLTTPPPTSSDAGSSSSTTAP